jgi:hypothetical protein
MRIGFIGSHRVGKTSVAEFITRNELIGEDFVFIPGSTRKIQAAGFEVNEAMNPVGQILTTLARFVDETRAVEENPDKHTITDRTPLCSLAYTKYQIDNVWEHSPEVDFYWEYSRKFVQQSMKDYDSLFYFSSGAFEIADPVDAKYRFEIDDLIISMLTEFGIGVEIVPSGAVRDRAKFVYDRIVL